MVVDEKRNFRAREQGCIIGLPSVARRARVQGIAREATTPGAIRAQPIAN